MVLREMVVRTTYCKCKGEKEENEEEEERRGE